MPKASEAPVSTDAPHAAGGAVAVRREGPIVTIVIDRRETRNALTDDVLDGIVETLGQLAADPEMRVAVLRGAGAQAFGSGMDLNELRKLTPATAQAHFDRLNRCLDAIECAPFPVIAMVYGFAVGGGCELAAACDLRIGGAGARIGVPVGRFGHCPDRKNLRRLLRLVSPGAVKAMIMTDMLFGAEEARQMGYFNWVVPDAALEPFTYAMASTVAQKSPLGLRALKQVLSEIGEGSVKHAEDPEKDVVTSLWGTADFQEGVAAFFEKRPPRFRRL